MEQWDYEYNDVNDLKKINSQTKKAINESLRQTQLTHYLQRWKYVNFV
jgi:hypothetical protein